MQNFISFQEGEANLDWLSLTEAIADGHRLSKAVISDSFLYRGNDTLLQRQAWIDGMGIGVKSATIFPGNAEKNKPVIHGAMSLFDDQTGALSAMIDFDLVTKWKTAGDSLLAARRLARADSQRILILGAGKVARNLLSAYASAFPKAQFHLWNRTTKNAERLAIEFPKITVEADLESAIKQADIISSALMTKQSVICGQWLQPGQHIDLIGAFRADMREADDCSLQRARIFVDSIETTLEHIGELKIPLSKGVIKRDDVLADYYNLELFSRQSEDEITLFKNGGGAHLDLMTSKYILDRWLDRVDK